MSVFKSSLKRLLNIVTTKRCKLCGNVIEYNREYCEECLNAPIISSPRCDYCGYSKEDCSCNQHKNEFKKIASVYYYEDSIVSAVHNFKDNDMPFLSKQFSSDMLKVIKECYDDISFDYITCVPLRKFKEFVRGFNQSKLIASDIAKVLDVPFIDCLLKTRYTGVQHHKSAAQRKADVFGAYDVKDEYKPLIDGKTILLIDDVKTTASTLNECAKMLNIYNAKAVYVSTLAITKKDKKQ